MKLTRKKKIKLTKQDKLFDGDFEQAESGFIPIHYLDIRELLVDNDASMFDRPGLTSITTSITIANEEMVNLLKNLDMVDLLNNLDGAQE